MEAVPFTCECCGSRFEVEYTFGEPVQCPSCAARFATDYDEGEDGLIGPWITWQIDAPVKQNTEGQRLSAFIKNLLERGSDDSV